MTTATRKAWVEQTLTCADCEETYQLKNPRRNKDGKQRCPRCSNNKRAGKKMGLTVKEYKELFESQKGVCAICAKPEQKLKADQTPYDLAVDHNHQTGKIRGLLCFRCNIGLGNLLDDPSNLYAAQKYLEKHTERPSWDNFFLGLAQYYKGRSKDPSTKVGSVIVRPNHTVAGMGYNGFPRGMTDRPEYLTDRAKKYPRTVHAEINALGTVLDHNLHGFVCYSTFMPCDRCFIQMASRGIGRFVFPHPTEDELTRWGESFNLTRELALDMNIELKPL